MHINVKYICNIYFELYVIYITSIYIYFVLYIESFHFLVYFEVLNIGAGRYIFSDNRRLRGIMNLALVGSRIQYFLVAIHHRWSKQSAIVCLPSPTKKFRCCGDLWTF